MMVNGIMVEISSNVGHKEYICVCVYLPYVCVCVLCVLDLGNFVVIILGYTTNAGACHVPSVCHCIDTGRGREGGRARGSARGGEALLRLFFLAATAWYWIWFLSKQNNRQTMPATILNNFVWCAHGKKARNGGRRWGQMRRASGR